MTTAVRAATATDVPRILELVHALATYERAADQVEATEEDFARALFPGDGHPATFAHVAEVDGQVVGIAVWFLTFSTWTGSNGIWLEDLFVDPSHRGTGLGRDLLAALARECVERGLPRLEWWVLAWNAPSIAFYDSLGAAPQDEWTTYRMSGEALVSLGTSD
ncbi:N-acetyltransferase family protein [Aeromicrobium sp. CF3.5]|uniref:GNAT family N-acetyltransferase n=1 Tax=Aeromicrobium sp. CF3.5 TaxID=3373078 RepID=UPI003EE69BB2